MSKKIKLTIQEIVSDFEKMVRCHERLDVLFDLEEATEYDIEKFNALVIMIGEKYLPGYESHMSEEYFSEDTPVFDKALELYGELYRNFKQMFYNLI